MQKYITTLCLHIIVNARIDPFDRINSGACLIHINCFCLGHTGIQMHGRNFATALDHLEPVALSPWDTLTTLQGSYPRLKRMIARAKENPEPEIGIGVGPMSHMGQIDGTRKIAYTVWETSIIPETERHLLKQAQQIWIPSSWGKSILIDNGFDEEQIRVIPEGVDPEIYRPLKSEPDSNRETKFRILFVGKWEERKGIDILLDAYARAFTRDDPVELILQSQYRVRQQTLPEIAAQASNTIGLDVIAGTLLSARAMVHLYNFCDVLVLPTRAEGWGLPIIEAMACGTPVIATGYSAHLDYVNNENAYLINVDKMVPAKDNYYFSDGKDYGVWAEPSVDHLAHLLRHIYEHREEAKYKAEVARRHVTDHWTWDHSARKAWREIKSFRSATCGAA